MYARERVLIIDNLKKHEIKLKDLRQEVREDAQAIDRKDVETRDQGTRKRETGRTSRSEQTSRVEGPVAIF